MVSQRGWHETVGAKLQIDADGIVIAENLDSRDAPKIVAAMEALAKRT